MQLLQNEIFVTILVKFRKKRRGIAPPFCEFYFSTISRIPMGQFLAQMPQAMHLEVGPSAG